MITESPGYLTGPVGLFDSVGIEGVATFVPSAGHAGMLADAEPGPAQSGYLTI